jgi:predicted amidohydrolase
MVPLAAAIALPGAGGTPAERCAWADAAITRARAAGAAIAVLPEAYLPGYGPGRANAGDAARSWMDDTARRHGISLAVGYVDGDRSVLGVTTPDGRHTAYIKRFPSPAEARVWRPGRDAVIAETPAGRVGLLVCADVLHRPAWEPYAGRVDAVLVAAAWPDYAGRTDALPMVARPALGWLLRESNPYREVWLAQAARAVGATVVFANATGPWRGQEGFSGGSRVYAADGSITGEGPVAMGPIGRAPPAGPLRHPLRWEAFTRVYRLAARA